MVTNKTIRHCTVLCPLQCQGSVSGLVEAHGLLWGTSTPRIWLFDASAPQLPPFPHSHCGCNLSFSCSPSVLSLPDTCFCFVSLFFSPCSPGQLRTVNHSASISPMLKLQKFATRTGLHLALCFIDGVLFCSIDQLGMQSSLPLSSWQSSCLSLMCAVHTDRSHHS